MLVLVLVLHGCAVTVSSTGAKNLLQGDDNGHVGRPCEVSLTPPCPEPFCELRGLCRHSYFGPRTCSRSEKKTKFIEVVMSTFVFSSQHKDAEYRSLVVGVIDSD